MPTHRRSEALRNGTATGQLVQEAVDTCGYLEAFTFSRQLRTVTDRPHSRWRERI